MAEIFNYNSFETNLDKSTRSLRISFKDDCLSMEKLFELESVMSWLTTRVEIQSVFIESKTQNFLNGWEDFKETLSESLINKVQAKLKKISLGMMHLPQTIICDLGQNVGNLGLEFSLGADMRIIQNGTRVRFNHLQAGILPSSGGFSVLSQVINVAQARNWVMSGLKINTNQLLNSGFVLNSYDETTRNDLVHELLMSIRNQAPVQRVQAKLGLFEPIRLALNILSPFEDSLHRASLVNEDWKKLADLNAEFMPAKSFSEVVKQTQTIPEPIGKNQKKEFKNNVRPFVIKGGKDNQPMN